MTFVTGDLFLLLAETGPVTDDMKINIGAGNVVIPSSPCLAGDQG